MFEYVGDFSYFWAVVCEGCPCFVFVAFIGLFLVFFCVVFDSLVFVEDSVGSYYFMQLVVLMSILFVFSLVLMRGNAFW